MEGPLSTWQFQLPESNFFDEIDPSAPGVRLPWHHLQRAAGADEIRVEVGCWILGPAPHAQGLGEDVESHGDDLDVPKDDGKLDREVRLVASLLMIVMNLL